MFLAIVPFLLSVQALFHYYLIDLLFISSIWSLEKLRYLEGMRMNEA